LVWLAGVRRVGKTVLAKELGDAEFLNCDLPAEAARLGDPETFFRSLARPLVILDEVHQLPDPSRVLKIATDAFPGLKVLATGSSTLAATRKFRDTLTGLKRSVILEPVLAEELPAFGIKDLQVRLLQGGLPPALLSATPDWEFYAEWLDSYFARDVQELFRVEKRHAFLLLVELILRQSGGLTEITSLAKHANSHRSAAFAKQSGLKTEKSIPPSWVLGPRFDLDQLGEDVTDEDFDFDAQGHAEIVVAGPDGAAVEFAVGTHLVVTVDPLDFHGEPDGFAALALPAQFFPPFDFEVDQIHPLPGKDGHGHPVTVAEHLTTHQQQGRPDVAQTRHVKVFPPRRLGSPAGRFPPRTDAARAELGLLLGAVTGELFDQTGLDTRPPRFADFRVIFGIQTIKGPRRPRGRSAHRARPASGPGSSQDHLGLCRLESAPPENIPRRKFRRWRSKRPRPQPRHLIPPRGLERDGEG
jgi:hypothetical protein